MEMISPCCSKTIQKVEEGESMEQDEESESVAEQTKLTEKQNLQNTVTVQDTVTQTGLPSVVRVLTEQLLICQS